MPVYDMIEYQLVKRRIPNGFPTRLVYRTSYIVLVAFIAITLPFFGGESSAPMHCHVMSANLPWLGNESFLLTSTILICISALHVCGIAA